MEQPPGVGFYLADVIAMVADGITTGHPGHKGK